MNKTVQNSKVSKLIGFILILALILTANAFAAAGISPAAAEGGLQTKAGITYDNSIFDLSEDYSAFVDAAVYNDYAGSSAQNRYVLLDDVRKEMKMQLDYGKSGLLITSKATGKDVEGESFKFEKALSGDFNIDFRAFSKETYQGSGSIQAVSAGGNEKGSLYDDRFNPYMDIRTVGIKITSASNPAKSFTVYVHGASDKYVTTTSASVYIEGESYLNQGRKGYGLVDGTTQTNSDGINTVLHGTTFSNVVEDKDSYNNSISFDVNKMCVYGTSYSFSSLGSSTGYKYEENQLLIRNLATNNAKDDNTGADFLHTGASTLSKDDFIGGYYVEVIIESMTGDDVPLTVATAVADGSGASAVYDENTAAAEIPSSAYARKANLIIYNVNGQDFRVYEGFDAAQKAAVTFPVQSGVFTSGITSTGLRLTSKAKNTAAEGNSFILDGDDFTEEGIFEMAFNALSTHYGATGPNEKSPWDSGPATYDYYGLGTKLLEYDPYSDVRELSLTFRSKQNSTKAFTVYFSSRDTNRCAMSVRVAVEGESYRNNNGMKGFGYQYSAWNNNRHYANSGGTFGMGNVTDTSAYYNNTERPWVPIRFNPEEMTVYTSNYGSALVRDLSENSLVPAAIKANGVVASLDSADFVGGFSVELGIERMNNENNRGLKTHYSYYNGVKTAISSGYNATASDGIHILNSGYDRPAIIDIYKINGDKTLSASDVTFSGETDYYNVENKIHLGEETLIYDVYNNNYTLTPQVGNVFDGYTTCQTSIAYAHTTKDDSGSIPLVGGAGIFTPLYIGIYEFSYMHNSTLMTGRITLIDGAPPEISFTQSFAELVGTTIGFTISESDVKTSDLISDVSLKISCEFNGKPIDNPTSASHHKIGYYEITYSVSDDSGNTAVKTRAVAVMTDDTDAPKISFNAPAQILKGEEVDFSGITAIDVVEGAVTAVIDKVTLVSNGAETTLTVQNGKVSSGQTGEIFIYVSATDGSGNKAVRVYRVEVRETLREVVDANTYGQIIADSGGGDVGCSGAFSGYGSVGGILTLIAAAAVFIMIKRKKA